MIEVALALVSIALAGCAGTAVVLALRLGQRTAAEGVALAVSGSVTKQLSETAHEFADYKRRTDAQLEAARRDVEELQHDLESCTDPGARRARLQRLLGRLARPVPGDPAGSGRTGVPTNPAPAAPVDRSGGAG